MKTEFTNLLEENKKLKEENNKLRLERNNIEEKLVKKEFSGWAKWAAIEIELKEVKVENRKFKELYEKEIFKLRLKINKLKKKLQKRGK